MASRGDNGITVSAIGLRLRGYTASDASGLHSSFEPVADALLQNGVFCVNVLREIRRTSPIPSPAQRCARTREVRLRRVGHATYRSAARAERAGAFDCRVTGSDRIGSHFVVLGSVEDFLWRARGHR